MFAELFGHGDCPGGDSEKIGFEVVDFGAVGAEAGEKATSGGSANRLVGVGVREGDAGIGNAVDVGGLGEIVTVTSEIGFEIVDDDHQDVGFGCAKRWES